MRRPRETLISLSERDREAVKQIGKAGLTDGVSQTRGRKGRDISKGSCCSSSVSGESGKQEKRGFVSMALSQTCWEGERAHGPQQPK